MSRQNRQNVFIDVTPTNPDPAPPQEEILDMKPPEEIPPPEKPSEKEIFKKPELKLEKPTTKRKADRLTDQKRTVTPKMRAHLDRIRSKASEAKKKKAAERAGVPYEPPAPEPEPVAEPVPQPVAPQPVAQPPSMPTIQESVRSVNPYPQHKAPEIDYDRIVNGLWSRQQKYNEEQKYLAQMREQIRKEEREKALKESSTLFQAAAVKYKKNQQAQLGNSVLSNYQNRYQGHPVFKLKQNTGKFETSGGATPNPFDACFK